MDTDAQSHAQLSWTLTPSSMPNCHGHRRPVPCPTIIDTDAQFHAQLSWTLTPSPMQRSVDAVLAPAACKRETNVQRCSYGTTCILLPLCTVSRQTNGSRDKSVYEAGGLEAGNEVAKPYSEVMGWVQARLSFAICTATN